MPLLNVDVAVPVILRSAACTPPANVEVAPSPLIVVVEVRPTVIWLSAERAVVDALPKVCRPVQILGLARSSARELFEYERDTSMPDFMTEPFPLTATRPLAMEVT